jgi:hypothetical protein
MDPRNGANAYRLFHFDPSLMSEAMRGRFESDGV